jgi:zinc protease
MTIWAAIVALAVITSQTATPPSVLSRYVEAIGGDAAIRAVTTRVTEGEFDNGRGLKTRYRIVEASPNKRITIIGSDPVGSTTGSARAYDGTNGWDNNFIGTGLRVLAGRELADAARDADMLRPLHLLDDCASTTVETTATQMIIVCSIKAGGVMRHAFDNTTGLLAMQDIDSGSLKLHIAYGDYRTVDGVKLPFRTRIEIPGATIKYEASSISHNRPVDSAIFQQPKP